MSPASTRTPSLSTRSRASSWRRGVRGAGSTSAMPRATCSSSLRSWASATSCPAELVVQLQRQPEQREERLGVEEEAEIDDLPVLDLQHLEGPGLVVVASVAWLVLAERGRAVCGHGLDQAGALGADAR